MEVILCNAIVRRKKLIHILNVIINRFGISCPLSLCGTDRWTSPSMAGIWIHMTMKGTEREKKEVRHQSFPSCSWVSSVITECSLAYFCLTYYIKGLEPSRAGSILSRDGNGGSMKSNPQLGKLKEESRVL